MEVSNAGTGYNKYATALINCNRLRTQLDQERKWLAPATDRLSLPTVPAGNNDGNRCDDNQILGPFWGHLGAVGASEIVFHGGVLRLISMYACRFFCLAQLGNQNASLHWYLGFRGRTGAHVERQRGPQRTVISHLTGVFCV